MFTSLLIQIKIMEYLDNFTIIKLIFSNTFKFHLQYYKSREVDTSIELNLQIEHIIKIIQKNRMDILDILYIHMKEFKFKDLLYSFCILYGSEEMLEELMKRDYPKMYQNWFIEKYIIGLELLFFKFRNHLYATGYHLYIDKIKIWFDIFEYPGMEYFLKDYYQVKLTPLHYKYYLHFENEYKIKMKEDSTIYLVS